MKTFYSTLTFRMIHARNSMCDTQGFQHLFEHFRKKINSLIGLHNFWQNNLINALIMTGAVIFLSGTASWKRVAEHIMVSKNWLPSFDLGKGPTQSKIICSNYTQMTGIGINGAGGIFLFGLPVTWHTWQVQQCWDASFSSHNATPVTGKEERTPTLTKPENLYNAHFNALN